MPPKVTASIRSRKGQLPVSPPIVPASRVRIRLIQTISTNLSPGAAPAAQTMREMTRMTAPEASASQAIIAAGPRASVLSKA